VPVRWVVARDKNLTNVVKSDVIETNEGRDYTVKVDVVGLRPGAPYFYGFLAGEARSPVGRTRTLPQGRLEALTMAVVSCASYPHGFFNAYEAIAKRDDIDLVVHLGDYIYEYGLGGYGGETGVALGRIPSPEIECRELQDYRQRHAQYKAEKELQDAHALCPWIMTWDDHEIADDSWSGGAVNHQPDEGAWSTRKRAALQAYYEWVPIRDPASGGAFEAINRLFQFGDLFTLAMLETRLLARTKQLDYLTEMPLYSTPWDFSNPQAPQPVSPAATYPASVRLVPVPYEVIDGRLAAIWRWDRVKAAVDAIADPPANIRFVPDREKLAAMLRENGRAMLGPEQETWLAGALTQSHRDGVVWQLLGNQTLMAEVRAPDLSGVPAETAAALEQAQPGAARLLFFSQFALPLSTDSWDGYPEARARLLDIVRQAGGNTIVLTGDSHAAWANELPGRDGQRVAVELGTTSITSPGFGDVFAGADLDLEAMIAARNAQVKWNDQRHRGFLALTLNKTSARAEFVTVSSIMSKEYETAVAAAFVIAADDAPGVGALTPAAAAAPE
jgi:alkaline phosphatase D